MTELQNPFVCFGDAETVSEAYFNALDILLITRDGATITIHLRGGAQHSALCKSEEGAISVHSELRNIWHKIWVEWRNAGAIQ